MSLAPHSLPLSPPPPPSPPSLSSPLSLSLFSPTTSPSPPSPLALPSLPLSPPSPWLSPLPSSLSPSLPLPSLSLPLSLPLCPPTPFSHNQGGYNLSSISKSMAMCTSVLLGDPPPALIRPLPPPHHSAVATINEVIRCHAPYWGSLRIHSQYPTSCVSFPCLFKIRTWFFAQSQSPCGPPCHLQRIVGNVVPEEKAESQRRPEGTNLQCPHQDSRALWLLKVLLASFLNEEL